MGRCRGDSGGGKGQEFMAAAVAAVGGSGRGRGDRRIGTGAGGMDEDRGDDGRRLRGGG